jgi:hypothetical protein
MNIKTNPSQGSQPFSINGLRVRSNLRAGKPLGDCCADLTHFTGLDRLAALYTQTTGKDCGCKKRQDWLNKLVPNFLGE